MEPPRGGENLSPPRIASERRDQSAWECPAVLAPASSAERVICLYTPGHPQSFSLQPTSLHPPIFRQLLDSRRDLPPRAQPQLQIDDGIRCRQGWCPLTVSMSSKSSKCAELNIVMVFGGCTMKRSVGTSCEAAARGCRNSVFLLRDNENQLRFIAPVLDCVA